MDAPKWTDVCQAITSAITAFFTVVTAVLVAIYTYFTRRSLTVAERQSHETLRPVIVLSKVDGEKQRLATFRNTGSGVAVDLRFQNATDTPITVSSNVLAPGGELTVEIKPQPAVGVIDAAYKSLEGESFRTVCSFSAHGRTYNRYLLQAGSLLPGEVERVCNELRNSALNGTAADYLNAVHL